MQKNTEVYYRPGGEFHGMARMCYQTEYNPDARKSFTLFLREMNGSAPGGKIKLLPGETRVFSAWVNNDWTWGWETSDGYNVRAFFDFAADKDFGNRDGRTKNTFGVESVPGWDTRAGLQTDHMGYAWRDQSTLYDFEKQPGARVGGFVSLRLTDEVVAEAQPMRVLPPGNPGPDFMVELMAGNTVDYTDSADVKYTAPKDLAAPLRVPLRQCHVRGQRRGLQARHPAPLPQQGHPANPAGSHARRQIPVRHPQHDGENHPRPAGRQQSLAV